MSLATLLQAAQPRESSGSQTAARYDYQANISILKLLELYQAGSDYRMLFDVYDDLTVLDSSNGAPLSARFYQVKSKDKGVWTSTELCKKVGLQSPGSYMARMYEHVDRFGASVAETGFITNASFDLILANGSKTTGSDTLVLGDTLDAAEVSKFEVSVKTDWPSADVPAWLPILSFHRSSLGVHSQRAHVVGHLQELLEAQFATSDVKTGAVYDALHAKVRAMITYTTATNFSGYCLHKSITADEFSRLIDAAISRPRSIHQDWQLLAADLLHSGLGVAKVVRVQTAANRYLMQRAKGEASATALSAELGVWIQSNSSTVADANSVVELAKTMSAQINAQHSLDDLEILGICVVEAYEAICEL